MEKNKLPYEIRWARTEEWAPAMTMIWKTFMKFEGKEYSEEGIQNFFDFITDDGLYQAFLKGNYQMMVALDGCRIVGAGSIRNSNHLSLLFVDEEYHHKGIGASLLLQLCDYLEKEEGERYISLTAAPYAVDFYRKLGFCVVAPEQEISGIRITPMEKVFDSRGGVD